MNVEQDIVEALLEAAEYKRNEIREVTIKRGEKELFTFSIESLPESAWRKARRENTLNRGRRNEELDSSRYFAQLIFEATVPEDRKRLWQSRAVQERLNVATGIDVADKVLMPAEKIKIVEVLEELSGFGDDGLEDIIKKN